MDREQKFAATHLEALAALAEARHDGLPEMPYQALNLRGLLGAALDLKDWHLVKRKLVEDAHGDEGELPVYEVTLSGRQLLEKLIEAANTLLPTSRQ